MVVLLGDGERWCCLQIGVVDEECMDCVFSEGNLTSGDTGAL